MKDSAIKKVSILMCAVMFVMGFSACTKEDEGSGTSDTKSTMPRTTMPTDNYNYSYDGTNNGDMAYYDSENNSYTYDDGYMYDDYMGGDYDMTMPNATEPNTNMKNSPEINTQANSHIVADISTDIFDYGENRLTNLHIACSSIHGYELAVGETFSFNEILGRRTKEKGYEKAIIFKGDETAKDYGGGICQLSSTLHMAALSAGYEIVERHEHSQPVDYAKEGEDATVYYDGLDFKFKNTGDSDIVIKTILHPNTVQVVFEIK